MKPFLSIIVPVKTGDTKWKDLLTRIPLQVDIEILLVGPDFQSHDGAVKYVYCQGNRASKQNAGVLKSSGKHLLFLHADSLFTPEHLNLVITKLKNNPHAFYHFDLAFDCQGLMRINTIFANLRSRYLKMPFGDQAFFMSKKTFILLGFFDEKAKYGEDHLLVWRAHQRKIAVMPVDKTLTTSARKYLQSGWTKTTCRHLMLTYLQAYPEFLKKLNPANKNHKYAIAIFVKTPGYSAIKTRLAEKIGKEKAEEFFKLSLLAIEEVVLQLIKKSEGKVIAYWAISEPNASESDYWSGLPSLTQGNGNLGERLFSIQEQLKSHHENFYFIGADSPHISADKLWIAFNAPAAKHVLGKTDDGGFYLYGSSTARDQDFWTGINYSCESTAQELINKLGADNFYFLPQTFDIDYQEDLQKLAALPIDTDTLPAQKNVIEWARRETIRPA